MAAGAVYTRLYIEGNEYFMTLKKAQAQTQEWAKDTTKNVNTVGRDFANLARSVIGITAAFQTIKKTVSEGINFNKFVAEQTAAFGVMMKSTDAAKAKIQELYTFAVESPLTFKETVSASKQLLAYGFSAESLVKNMEMLGTVAKATGHSLDDISYVYGTLKTQNRAYSRDLMQFAMRGIPIYDELASVMGVTTQQIKKLTEQGAVGFEQVEQAFKNMTGEGGRFAGMMDAYMRTLSGQLSMLGDIAQQSAGNIASGITTALTAGLSGIMTSLGDSSDYFKKLGADLGVLASVMLDLTKALIKALPLVTAFVKLWIGTKIISMLTSLPAILLKGANGLLNMAIGAEALNASFLTLGATSTVMFTQIRAGLAMLTKQLLVLAANPYFLAAAAIIGGGVALVSAAKKSEQNKADLKATDPLKAFRNQALLQSVSGRAAVSRGDTSTAKIAYSTEQMTAAAKEFGISVYQVATILESMGMTTTDVVDSFRELDSAVKAARRAQQQAMDDAANAKGRATLEATAWGKLAIKLGLDVATMRQSMPVGGGAASDFMEAIRAKAPTMDDMDISALQALGLDKDLIEDRMKEVLQAQLDVAQTALYTVVDELPDPKERPKLKSDLVDWINGIMLQLEGLGKKAKEVEKDLWFAREWQAKASESKIDDLTLERDKAQATAEKKYLVDKSITEEEYYAASLAIHEWYWDEREKEEKERLDKLYTNLKEGDSEFFGKYRRDAASNFETGDYAEGFFNSLMAGFDGSGIGKFIASTDKAATAVIALGEAAAETADEFVSQLLDKIEGINISQSIDNITSGIADFVNNIFGWGDDAADSVESLEDAISGLEDLLDSLQDEFDALIARAEELIEIQVDSMQDLYEVGAMSGSQYETEVNDLWSQHAEELKEAYELAGQTYPEDYATEGTLSEVYAALMAVATELGVTQEQLDATQTQLDTAQGDTAQGDTSGLSDAAAGAAIGAGIGSIFGPIGTAIGAGVGALGGAIGDWLGWWDVGSTNIPKDQMGTVHAGEAVIPQTFAEGIRSGEMVLSGTDEVGSGGSPVYVTVNVEGSVSAENDLATSVAQAIYTQRKRGLLTV